MGEELVQMTEEFQMKCRERDYKNSSIIMQILPKKKRHKIRFSRSALVKLKQRKKLQTKWVY